MHILYLHQHFATPAGTTGTRSYEFARRWVTAGHKVTILTGHYDIGGLGPNPARRQTLDGIDIVIAGSRYSNKQSLFGRLVSFARFIFGAILVGLRLPKVDIVYATSTPLTVGIPAIWIKRIKRIPMVFEVRDQWPQIPIELGYIRNPFLKGYLLRLERRIYLHSRAIVALSPGMAEGIRKVLGGTERTILVVPNCCDLDRFRPVAADPALRTRHGWDNKFILMHIGAMGKANGLDFVLDAAAKLRETPDIHFVLIGDGSQRRRLSQRIAAEDLTNVEILDPIPKNRVPGYLQAADIGLAIFADYPIIEHNSANKFFDALSSGKPVLLNYSGWQRDLLESAGAGFGIPQGHLELFLDKIRWLYDHHDQLDAMGRRARELAEKCFSRSELSSRVLSLFESLVKRRHQL